MKVTEAAVANNYLYVVRTNHTDNVAGTTYATVGCSYTADVTFFTLDIANGKAYPYAMNKGYDAMAYVVTKNGVATDIYVVYGAVTANVYATSSYTKPATVGGVAGTYSYAMEAGKVTNAMFNATATYTVTIDGAVWKEVVKDRRACC